jgi:hypothetical protein
MKTGPRPHPSGLPRRHSVIPSFVIPPMPSGVDLLSPPSTPGATPGANGWHPSGMKTGLDLTLRSPRRHSVIRPSSFRPGEHCPDLPFHRIPVVALVKGHPVFRSRSRFRFRPRPVVALVTALPSPSPPHFRRGRRGRVGPFFQRRGNHTRLAHRLPGKHLAAVHRHLYRRIQVQQTI